jgi:uncharacterized protein (DUF1697 family)
MTRQVALLRGINLARSRRVSMAELRRVLADAGHDDVKTHLQSGNVVFSSGVRGAALERRLERELADALGIEIKVLVRSRAELAAIVKRDPLGDVADNLSRYLVTFLAGKLEPKKVKELAALAVEPERFAAHGRELYSWHPGGASDSALWKKLADKRLGVTATARNWNTVKKLLELADA